MWQAAAADQYLRVGDQSRGGSGTNSSGTGIARIGRASVGLGALEISSRFEGEVVVVDPGPAPVSGFAPTSRPGGGLRRSVSSSRCAISSTCRLSSGLRVETVGSARTGTNESGIGPEPTRVVGAFEGSGTGSAMSRDGDGDGDGRGSDRGADRGPPSAAS